MKTGKHIRRSIRRPLETAGFTLLGFLIPPLPRQGVVALAAWIGKTVMFFPSEEKRIGLINLDAVYGDTKTKREKLRILETSFSTFVLTMLDIVWFSRKPAERIREYVSFKPGPNHDSFFEDKGIVCISAHMGNWEVMGQTCALMGVNMASIAAPVKNKAVDRTLIRLREKTGQTIVPKKGALRTLVVRLRKNGRAAFVLDQHTKPEEGGIPVDFLGFPMHVSPGPAALAYRTGSEIMVGFCLPEANGRYGIDIVHSIVPPPFEKERDMDEVVHKLTQQIEDVVGDAIRATPQFWLWSYKHWRRRPGERYPARYPVY